MNFSNFNIIYGHEVCILPCPLVLCLSPLFFGGGGGCAHRDHSIFRFKKELHKNQIIITLKAIFQFSSGDDKVVLLCLS